MRKLRPRKQQGKRVQDVYDQCRLIANPEALWLCHAAAFKWFGIIVICFPSPIKSGVPSQNWLFRSFGQMNVSSSKMSSLREPVLFTDVFSMPRTVPILWTALNKCLWMKEWNEIGIFIFYKITCKSYTSFFTANGSHMRDPLSKIFFQNNYMRYYR